MNWSHRRPSLAVKPAMCQTEVTASRISDAADPAHLSNRALRFAATGNAAGQAVELDFWQTRDFVVEDLHTYVAGGVRVHNKLRQLTRLDSTRGEHRNHLGQKR
jgi:hypothetical protein